MFDENLLMKGSRMKTPIKVLFTALAIAVFAMPIFAVQLPLTNGGFESWVNNGPTGPPDGWSEDVSDSINVTQEATTIHGGSYSANLTWTSPTQDKCDFISNDIFTVTAGDACSLSVNVYDNDLAGRITIYFIFNTANSFPSNYFSVDQASWQQLSYKVNAPAGATSMQVAIRAYDISGSWDGNATVYVDDIEVWGPEQPQENVPPSVGPIYFYPYPIVYPTDDVNVRATINDVDGTVDYDTLWVQTTALAYDYVMHDSIVGNNYWYNLGTNAIGTLVEFYVVAVDDDADASVSSTYSYTVADPTPTVKTIAEVNYTEDAGNPLTDCYPSPENGNTVTVSGVVNAIKYNDPTYKRFYLQDADSTWSGINVFTPPAPVVVGDSVTLTGPITEYYSVTEVNVPTSITIHGTGTVHAPIVVTSDDIPPDTCDVDGESYESMLVRLENVLCVVATAGSEAWVKSDGATDSCVISSYIFGPPPTPNFIAGQRYNITGIVSYFTYRFVLYPRNAADVELIPPPEPIIGNVQQTPPGTLVDPSASVVVSAEIVDYAGMITTVIKDSLYVRLNGGAWAPIAHDNLIPPTYYYTIGTNVEGTFVEYYIIAVDDNSNRTETDIYSYTATSYVPTCANEISAIQTTVIPGAWPDCYPSPLDGQAVDICGIVTGAKLDETGSCSEYKFFIQDEAGGTWQGVYVYDAVNVPISPFDNGDEVEVFGTVDEYNGLTEVAAITEFHVISSGNPDLVPVNTKVSEFESDCSFATEPLEGVLVKFKGVTIMHAGGPTGTWWISDTTSADSVLLTNYLYYGYLDCRPNPPLDTAAYYDSLTGCMYWYGSSSNPTGGYWRIYPRCGTDFYDDVLQPIGACCVEGVCTATNTAAECAALTGEWFIGAYCTDPDFDCPTLCYEYLPGDVNMSVYTWPPAYLSGDVTYLVNYFRGLPSSVPCKMYNPIAATPDPGPCFFASADVNGSCTLVGADVTKLVNVFRGLTTPASCSSYVPCWPTPGDLPPTAPAGWPNCEVPCPPVTVTGERVIDTPDLGGK